MKTSLSVIVGFAFLSVGLVGCATHNSGGFVGKQSAPFAANTLPRATITHARPETLQPLAYRETTEQSPLAMPSAPALTIMEPSDDFSDLLKKAPGVVLVDFYADWCGPCKLQGEILDEMQTTAAQHQATIIKVNIDQHRELADQFQISGIPTLMLISEGKIIDRTSGIADRQTVSTMLAY